MRSLIRRAAADGVPHDPAPSRLAYRIERLLLTPLIRSFLRLGLPVFATVLLFGVLASDEDRRQAVSDWVVDVRDQLANRPEFLVHAISIDGASEALSADIREVLPIDFPVSSFDLDLDQMVDVVLALDPVANASMTIGTGGILRLSVVERKPVAVWRLEDELDLVDAEGFVVARIEHRTDRPDLPLIAGEGAGDKVGEALSIFAAARPLAGRLRGLTRVGERRWNIVLDRDQVIMLPEFRPVAALEQVLALDQAQDLLDRDVTVVDMRTPRRPTLRLAKGAQEELRKIRMIETGAASE